LKNESLSKYEKVTSKNMEKRAQRLFEKFQDAGVDPIGFGLRFRVIHSGSREDKMRQWNALYTLSLNFR